MENKLEILGNENDIIYYNLNKQFNNINKIIITSQNILSSFEDSKVKDFFENLKDINSGIYMQKINETLESDLLESNLDNNFYTSVQEKLNLISQNVMDIQLKGCSFISSASNSKFNVVLRTENFSITRYFEEKGAILSSIKQLLKKYLEFEGNSQRLLKIKNFQLEIYEAEDVYKHIYLKKEDISLILASSFGFAHDTPVDYYTGSEIYYLKGEDYKLFENTQTYAVFRDHAKLNESEIHKQKKILSDEDLVSINKATKDINDAIIELYINKKGNLRILNISLIDNKLEKGSANGIILNKSSKSYNRISLVGLRDNLDEELPNPKYLLIRNPSEVEEILSNFKKLNKIDGIIFTENFYSPVLDYIGEKFDLDIIYYKFHLDKTFEIKLDLENIEIGDRREEVSFENNPFSNILSEPKKEKDEFLERLKNIDLSTPKTPQKQEDDNMSQVSNIAEKIISSPNSKINSENTPSLSSFGSSSDEKVSAIGMLANSVLNKDSNNPPQEIARDNFSPSEKQIGKESSDETFLKSSLIMDNANPKEVKPLNIESQTTQSSETSKYKEVLATKIITSPQFNQQTCFVDSNTLNLVTGEGEIYYFTSSVNEINNPHMKYILPVGLKTEGLTEYYYIVNKLGDFFLMDDDDKFKYLLNLSYIDDDIKSNYLKKCFEVCKLAGVVIMKRDIDLIAEYINKINLLFVKDISTSYEFETIKDKILGFEKRFLMNN